MLKYSKIKCIQFLITSAFPQRSKVVKRYTPFQDNGHSWIQRISGTEMDLKYYLFCPTSIERPNAHYKNPSHVVKWPLCKQLQY